MKLKLWEAEEQKEGHERKISHFLVEGAETDNLSEEECPCPSYLYNSSVLMKLNVRGGGEQEKEKDLSPPRCYFKEQRYRKKHVFIALSFCWYGKQSGLEKSIVGSCKSFIPQPYPGPHELELMSARREQTKQTCVDVIRPFVEKSRRREQTWRSSLCYLKWKKSRAEQDIQHCTLGTLFWKAQSSKEDT